jgi:N-acetylornithine carbamoyltransferase
MNLLGRDLISTQEWTVAELEAVLDLALRMKQARFSPEYARLLERRTFFMFFYNPSVRTRQSFECAATELGGHAQFLEPASMRLKTQQSAGETIEDAAQVMSRYACGLGIRILEDKIGRYGEGDQLVREYARWSSVPVISMGHDTNHPCQGLADIMGLRQHLGDLAGRKALITWASGALARSWCSVQEALLIYSRFGMDITLAHPEGYALDPPVIAATRQNCAANGRRFEIVHDPDVGYAGAHVVYARNWMSPQAYAGGEFHKADEIARSLAHPDWICNAARMRRSADALFTHPMPVDRGHEVSDEVASGRRSIIYDVAENRLHVQKAVMALTMAGAQ